MCSRGNLPQHPCSRPLLQLTAGVLLTRNCHSCIEGGAPVALAGDGFRPVQVQEGRFLLPAFARREICWSATGGGTVRSYSYLQRLCSSAYMLRSQAASFREVFTQVYFLEKTSFGALGERPKTT